MKYLKNLLLIALSLFFLACEDKNTKEPIVTDIESLTIDGGDITIYSTDAPINLSATVSFKDGTNAKAEFATWNVSDYEIIKILDSTLWGGEENGGDANLTIQYDKFNDTVDVKVIELTSFFISSDEISSTGDYILEAKGDFVDGEANRTIVKNIIWTADNGAEIVTEDDVTTITIKSGDTNVTATVFSETNTSSPIAPVSVVYSVE